MIRSMTGFGRCETVINGREITVEIKSVNHRYFEFSCRTPRSYGFLDDKLKNYVNSRVSRGKIDMFVSIGASDEEPCDVTVNHQLVSGYINAFKEISEKYDIPNDVSTVSLSRFPDVSRFTKHLRTRIRLLPMFFQPQRLQLTLLLQCVKQRARR